MNFHMRYSEFGANPSRHSKSRFSDFDFWFSGNLKILWFSILENDKVLIFEPILQHDGGRLEIFFHDMKLAEFHELSRTRLEKLIRQG